jgi:hypothetical protein
VPAWLAGLLATVTSCSPSPPADPAFAEAGAALPPGAEPAMVLYIVELEDEGVRSGLVESPSPGAYRLGDTLLASVPALLGVLSQREIQATIDHGRLHVDGHPLDMAGRLHEGVPFAPVTLLAEQFGALAWDHPAPDPGATLWPQPVLCAFAPRAHPQSAVLLAAARAGLLERCEPPVPVEVAFFDDVPDDAPWAATLDFEPAIADDALIALLERYGVRPAVLHGRAGDAHLGVGVPLDSASPALVHRMREEAIAAAERPFQSPPAPAAFGRTAPRPARPRGDYDPDAARVTLDRVRAGHPVIDAAFVAGTAAALRNLARDPAVARFEPATRVNGKLHGPGPGMFGTG